MADDLEKTIESLKAKNVMYREVHFST